MMTTDISVQRVNGQSVMFKTAQIIWEIFYISVPSGTEVLLETLHDTVGFIGLTFKVKVCL